MKKVFFLICILSGSLTAKTQTRNAVVKALNNYVQYSNANITALSLAINSLERYNGLFNDYLRNDWELGGEAYEKPKPSTFLDKDVFTMNEDDPGYLYSAALKGSVSLPAAVKTDLNKTMKLMWDCSQKITLIRDSMSNIFSGPMIAVTKDPEVLPYNLLYEAKRQLQLSKDQRDQLFLMINNYYTKACPLKTSATDYIRSTEPLTKGVELCQDMINDLSKNDSGNISGYVGSLDSLYDYLERSELTLLKGIAHFGNSKHFPNKGYYNGFDLYSKYEDIMNQLQIFSSIGKAFINETGVTKYPSGKCFYYHEECTSHFNSIMGLLYYYNEYVLLIGGGKMKIKSGVGSSNYIYKGWGDNSHSVPARTLLFWMKETPLFEIVY